MASLDNLTTRFKGKRLSRKIIPLVVISVIFVALLAFISKFGVSSKPLAEINKEKAEKEALEKSLQAASQTSEDSAKKDIEAREAKAQEKKRREAMEKEDKDKRSIKERLSASDRETDYPESMPSQQETSVDRYEKKKAAISNRTFGGGGNMAVYERFGGGLNGIPGLGQIIPKVPENSESERQMIEETKAEAAKAEQTSNTDENSAFSSTAKSFTGNGPVSNAIKHQIAPSRFMVMEGTTIPTVLLSAIHSQLPNEVISRVTQDVYDSIRGEYVLIPKGSIVNGKYNTQVKDGQDRVYIIFTRVVFPNGSSVNISNMNGGDMQGRGGVEGEVIDEFWASLGSSLLIAAVGAIADENNNGTVNNFGGGSGGINTSSGQILAETARNNIQRFARYRPKITVEAGEKLTIVVNKDMMLDPYQTAKGHQ